MWRRSQTDPELAAIEAAYDAVHDAFVRAVRYRGRLRDREASPGWVCRIVINEARKRSSVERRLLEPHGG
jgi:DNA-directed RNA polymerase specialized sigma24 family protein